MNNWIFSYIKVWRSLAYILHWYCHCFCTVSHFQHCYRQTHQKVVLKSLPVVWLGGCPHTSHPASQGRLSAESLGTTVTNNLSKTRPEYFSPKHGALFFPNVKKHENIRKAICNKAEKRRRTKKNIPILQCPPYGMCPASLIIRTVHVCLRACVHQYGVLSLIAGACTEKHCGSYL